MNNAQSGRAAAAQQMDQAIRDYITASNAGDAEAVAAICTPDAVHYWRFSKMTRRSGIGRWHATRDGTPPRRS
jgi:ketosteroid isomerase-like protein